MTRQAAAGTSRLRAATAAALAALAIATPSLHAGYRTVEGGADVEEPYNFAWLHYLVVSGCWRM